MLRARGPLFLPCAQGALVPAPRAHLNCIAPLGRGMDPGDSQRRAHQNLLPAAARPAGAGAAERADYPSCCVPACVAAAPPPQRVCSTLWRVHQGLALEAFFSCSGPPAVTGYNFVAGKQHKGRVLKKSGEPLAAVVRHHAMGASLADGLRLTEAGGKVRPEVLVYNCTYVCKGDGNCVRRCGGAGACVAGCQAGCKARPSAGARCSVRVIVSATAAEARQGVWSVSIAGAHNAAAAAEPPKELAATALAKLMALAKASSGALPITVAAQAQAAVGPGASSKHVVPHRAIARRKEHHAKVSRGVAPTDADRLHRYVAEVLVPRQLVLLYRAQASAGGLSLAT